MKKTVTLACGIALLVLAVGVVQAEVVMTLTPNADPAPGLKSYTVTITGTEGEQLVTFADYRLVDGDCSEVDGTTHHVWPRDWAADTWVPTPKVDQWTTGQPIAPGAWAVYDTHLLVPDDHKLTEMGPPLSEANDESNPVGLDLQPAGFETYLPKIGVGRWGIEVDTAQGCFALKTEHFSDSVELVQVVTTPDQPLWLKVTVYDADVRRTDICEMVQLPEPATMALLGLGSLGLILRRRRSP